MFTKMKLFLAMVFGLLGGAAFAQDPVATPNYGLDAQATVTGGCTQLGQIIGIVVGLAIVVILIWKAIKYFKKV